MVKIVEIKQTIYDSEIIENLHTIQKLSADILNEMQFLPEINKDDFQYLDVVLEKTKVNLLKIYNVVRT